MSTKNVSFEYSIDQTNFSTSADVDAKAWDEADADERADMLRDAVLEEIEEMIIIDESTIDDSED